MNDRYELGGLGNDLLLASIRALVGRENDALSDVLAHLAELDERGLCLELGYSSLFKYCTDALGFCKSAAGRRIAAARVCRAYPEAFARVAKGELKLSVLCELNKYLNSQNATELFDACSRKSFEDVELLLAARFPKPDVRDLVRRLPAKAVTTPDIGCAGPAEGGTASRVVSAPEAQHRAWLPIEPRLVTRAGTVKPLSAERFSMNFTADAEFRELLEEVRALLSHAEPKGALSSVMKRGLKALKVELLKARYGVGRKPRRVRVKEDGLGCATRTRYITADVTRAIWERDGGQCTFCSPDGRRCLERRFLQFDHVLPFAEGGEATVSNLRICCREHNLHAARKHFGTKFMRVVIKRTRARSESGAEGTRKNGKVARRAIVNGGVDGEPA